MLTEGRTKGGLKSSVNLITWAAASPVRQGKALPKAEFDDFGSGDAVGVGDYDDGDEDEEADLGVGDSDSDDSDGLVSDASEDAEDSEGFGSDEFEGAGDYDDGEEDEEADFGAGGSEEGEESDSGAEDGQEPVAAREPAVAKFVPRRVREQQQRAAAGSGVAEDAELAKEIRLVTESIVR